jgi:GNAT superfamily N-acetyltransferase
MRSVGSRSAVTLVVRIAEADDVRALASLRARWSEGEEPGFEERMAEWLEAEGERRTTWLALLDDVAVGMASLFEYRRMPRPGRDASRWGYLSNMFVLAAFRDRGIGAALLDAIVTTADERGYARLVLSPSERALPFYRRAGFVVPDEQAGDHRLVVRPTRAAGTAGTGR